MGSLTSQKCFFSFWYLLGDVNFTVEKVLFDSRLSAYLDVLIYPHTTCFGRAVGKTYVRLSYWWLLKHPINFVVFNSTETWIFAKLILKPYVWSKLLISFEDFTNFDVSTSPIRSSIRIMMGSNFCQVENSNSCQRSRDFLIPSVYKTTEPGKLDKSNSNAMKKNFFFSE